MVEAPRSATTHPWHVVVKLPTDCPWNTAPLVEPWSVSDVATGSTSNNSIEASVADEIAVSTATTAKIRP